MTKKLNQEAYNVTVVAWDTGRSEPGQYFPNQNTVIVNEKEYEVDTEMVENYNTVYIDHF